MCICYILPVSIYTCTTRLIELTVDFQNSKPTSCKMHAFLQNTINFALLYSRFVSKLYLCENSAVYLFDAVVTFLARYRNSETRLKVIIISFFRFLKISTKKQIVGIRSYFFTSLSLCLSLCLSLSLCGEGAGSGDGNRQTGRYSGVKNKTNRQEKRMETQTGRRSGEESGVLMKYFLSFKWSFNYNEFLDVCLHA